MLYLQIGPQSLLGSESSFGNVDAASDNWLHAITRFSIFENRSVHDIDLIIHYFKKKGGVVGDESFYVLVPTLNIL